MSNFSLVEVRGEKTQFFLSQVSDIKKLSVLSLNQTMPKKNVQRDILSMFGNNVSKDSKIKKPSVSQSVSTITSKELLVQKLSNSNSNSTFENNWTIEGTFLIRNISFNHTSVEIESSIKLAAFDLDGTLISTKSGGTFSKSPSDWKWWNDKVLDKLKDLYRDNYLIVIFSNQGGVVAIPLSKSYLNFTTKLNSIVKELKGRDILDRISIYAAPKKPSTKNSKNTTNTIDEQMHAKMRKPETGMWDTFLVDLKKYGITSDINYKESFFVGDAAGRSKDFSDSDALFSKNINLKFITPEELFT
ncbi:DNA 3'-phosphatase [Candida albicans P57072]|nr:DNA 3'-phosphatase [Candida albicans P57072]